MSSKVPEALGHHSHLCSPPTLTLQDGTFKVKNQVVLWLWVMVICVTSPSLRFCEPGILSSLAGTSASETHGVAVKLSVIVTVSLQVWIWLENLLLKWLTHNRVLVVDGGGASVSSLVKLFRESFECPHNMATWLPPEWITQENKVYATLPLWSSPRRHNLQLTVLHVTHVSMGGAYTRA